MSLIHHTIYHITSAGEATEATAAREYAPQGFAREGFIHCSYLTQICAVANRLFAGREDLVLLEIDPSMLACKVIDENLEGGAESFPHIYGQVPMAAVARIHRFPCNGDGRFELPATI